MKLNPKQNYKFIDKDLINGFVVLTGKELNEILEESYKKQNDNRKLKGYMEVDKDTKNIYLKHF